MGFSLITRDSLVIRLVTYALTVWLCIDSNLGDAQDFPTLKLQSSSAIPGFPSASAIAYCDRKLFVMGDDSRYLVILDDQHNKIDSIRVFDGEEKRIPQDVKADIESGLVVGRSIVLIGSSSSQPRHRSYLIKPSGDKRNKIKTLTNRSWLRESITSTGSVNIEGAMAFDRKLVCANRSMKGSGANFLFVTPLRPFLRGRSASVKEREIVIPDSINRSVGISDLYYFESNDLLLVTLSSEDSSNPLEDGAIGTSYVAWIRGFTDVFKKGVLRLQGVVDLTAIDSVFNGQKIEGVCAQRGNDGDLILHLVSDNDDGTSRIFRLSMSQP